MTIKEGDVIFVEPGTFIHDKHASGHPAIVIGIDKATMNVVICTDASHVKRRHASVDISDSGFKKPTMAICNKIGRLPTNKTYKKLGRVSSKTLYQVNSKIFELNSANNIFENWR